MCVRKSVSLILVAIIILLVLFSFCAYPAENATITGDKVNVREQPSIWNRIVQTLDKGTRVEVVTGTDFTDTIDGFTAPWYKIDLGRFYGFVFGRYVELDPGVTVPPLGPRDPYSDPMFRFIERGRTMFGGTRSAVIKALGRPVSVTEEKFESSRVDGRWTYAYVRTLTYKGVVVGVFESEKGWEYIDYVALTTDAYALDGLKVGSSVADVERILGPPTKVEGESLYYYTRYVGDAIEYYVSFKTKDAVIVEITFQGWRD
jgi:uncharacterized protein YraI